MSIRRIWATAQRILSQLRHDPRTIALMILAPCLLMTILKYVYQDQPQVFQRVAGSLLGVFPMLVMFLITSVATLRERTSGTLERLLILPISRLEFILGYAMAFGIAAFIQAVVVSTVALGPLGLRINGSQIMLILIAILDALLGMAIGLFISSFAKTEFQAVQFLPAILLPQLLLSGLLAPRESMPIIFQWIANFLPLTYAVEATKSVISGVGSIGTDLLYITVFLVALLSAGAVTLKRKSK
ncbi:MAG: ABC transporter permease [Actinobacteria bacterium]|nr:ABC transporter permease [Actinomycetota bacterium]